MKRVSSFFIICSVIITSTLAMKKEIEVKFALNESNRVIFERWLQDNATYQGSEDHEEIYFNNPQKTFFFDTSYGFTDAHTTMRVRSKKVTAPNGEISFENLFCSKFCHVNMSNDIISRDEFEINLQDTTSFEQVSKWLGDKGYQLHHKNASSLNKAILTDLFNSLGFIHQIPISKKRTLYEYQQFEIALDDIHNIGSFIEIELKSDEQDVVKGTESIYQFLRDAGIMTITLYTRSYLHMAINPGHDFSKSLSLRDNA